MNAENDSDHPKVIPHVILTGTAKEGSVGPPIGLVDIGVSEAAYIFRVCLPGIQKNQNKIKCEIQKGGRVCIQGEVPELAMENDSGSKYRMQVQQFCPAGPFSVSFNLPGQVDPRLFSPRFRPDGILEVVVVKLGGQIPTATTTTTTTTTTS
ncbi:PREDICTED: increased DNA methylation 3 [Tarenaya hassleriana]|uniref:increased DNA methylation 3 n=1 Tax=Tarenaya hassleriana TaxID=28532 RepID=UPI00053C3089|nr:PREDICTED: increased DNA methylation 3 [Tarenaya hassleriana]XP_010534311.1 PREDICTED: increased DNA methylation 3 [Tarenaya hassleriana]